MAGLTGWRFRGLSEAKEDVENRGLNDVFSSDS